jgi:citronellyl-CoA dehydrogenase
MFAAYPTVGQCQYALDRTRRFLHDRTVFGRPSAD